MNTIPTTFNDHHVEHTILGGKIAPQNTRFNLSVILLSRSGTTYRTNNLDTLRNLGFRRIVSVETSIDNYNLEDLSRRYPEVCFIVPHSTVTPGEMINLAMTEIDDGNVLVLWDTVSISTKLFSDRVVDKVNDRNHLVVVPSMADERGQMLNLRFIPYIARNTLALQLENLMPDGIHTAYPYDFMGIYNRKKFERIGGFDWTISSPYWQLLDFGIRGWLMGEKITISQQLRLKYDVPVQPEDTTVDYSQLRFFLKNLAPKYVVDHAYIPGKLLFSYIFRSGKTVGDAVADFQDARKWVTQNKYLFKRDAITLVQEWENLNNEQGQ
ncbi:MAG: hypothetical protein MJ178_05135 [Treponemataceae bacterium]|nr:hypothetical protein [Treponemataceae bacterium]